MENAANEIEIFAQRVPLLYRYMVATKIIRERLNTPTF